MANNVYPGLTASGFLDLSDPGSSGYTAYPARLPASSSLGVTGLEYDIPGELFHFRRDRDNPELCQVEPITDPRLKRKLVYRYMSRKLGLSLASVLRGMLDKEGNVPSFGRSDNRRGFGPWLFLPETSIDSSSSDESMRSSLNEFLQEQDSYGKDLP